MKKIFSIFWICFFVLFISSEILNASGKDNERDAQQYCKEQEKKGINCTVSAWVGCGPGWTKAKRFNRHRGKDYFACKKIYSYRTIEASLKKTTPLWTQYTKSSGHPSGCGNAAIAIVYGYWFQYKGKKNLFKNGTSSNELLKAHEEMAKYNKTKYDTWAGKKYGRTLPENMSNASKYAQKRGYNISFTRDRGTEFSKFDKVKKSLDADRPVILLTNDPLKALSTLHYVVIEKAEKKQRKWKNHDWKDRDVRYYVNFGNEDRKWITVREKGINDDERTGSFSMFHIDIN